MPRGARRTKHKKHGGARGRRTDGSAVLTGVLSLRSSGKASVETDAGVFSVARGGVREAMNGDTVAVTISRRGSERFAHVQHVIERATTSFLGTYEDLDAGLGVVVPLDGRIRHDFFVLPGDSSPARLGVGAGDLVQARILDYPARGVSGTCTLDERVGQSAELDLGQEAVIAGYGLETAFSDAVLAEAAAVRVDAEAALAAEPDRRDVRGQLCCTIDPADARDFDDAVGCEALASGGWRVHVHIADVSAYVPWGSSTDLAARQRGCSVYLADRVIPMLPEALSNDACSLNPGQDRLAMSVEIELDARGNVLGAEAYPSVMRSQARLDYDAVDAFLSGELPEEQLALAENSPYTAVQLGECLRGLAQVSALRQRVRHARGAIDFESVETKVVLDEAGVPVGVRVRTRSTATSLVEEAMLLANEAVAALLAAEEVETCYRVHETPSPESLAETLPTLVELGLLGNQAEQERLVAGDAFAIRAVLERAAGTQAEEAANAVLLRAMKRAIYLPHNEGHYALAAPAYCHFTSPIRRYPDLMVHRALKRHLGMPYGRRVLVQEQNQLAQICRSSSDAERTAENAERDSQKIKLAELVGQHVGEAFSGVVSGVIPGGIFVRLDGVAAEGRIARRDLGHERYEYDDEHLRLTGEESGTVYCLGKRVAVRVEHVDSARGYIDLLLADGSELQAPDLVVGIR